MTDNDISYEINFYHIILEFMKGTIGGCMKTILFYFSATGNSLTTARMLAEEWNECELVPLASLNTQEEIIVQADTVGFVFPIYYSNMPYIMRQAISKMHFVNTSYIFSICTCRGHYGNIAQRLNALLQERNQFLSLSRHICLPGNSRISSLEQNAIMLELQHENIHTIAVENYYSETILTIKVLCYQLYCFQQLNIDGC